MHSFTQGSGAKVHGNSLEIGPGMDVTWKKVGDVIAVGNDPQAGTTPSQTLADNQSYQDFLSAAGAPSGANVSLYVDTPGIIGMFPGIGRPQPQAPGRHRGLDDCGRLVGHHRPVRPGQISAAAAGRYSPNAVRSAPQTSPSVASARTASRIAGIRLS